LHPCQAIAGVAKIMESPQYRSVAQNVQDDIEGVHSFLQNLKIGVGPKDAEDWTDFFKLVLARCEHFIACTASQKLTKVAGKLTFEGIANQKLVGREALLHEFRLVEEKMTAKEGGDINMSHLRIFKMFGWLLDKKQHEQVQSWIGRVSEKAGGDLLALTAGDADAGGVGGALEVHGGLASCGGVSVGGSSSSSSAGASKASGAQQAKKDDLRASMMKFFVGKKAAS
jgi:hypothetical protein